jgi:hypothetical protein
MSLEAIQQAYDQERFAEALRACLEALADARERGDDNAARPCVDWLTQERSLLLKGCRAAVVAQDENLLERLSDALAEGGILIGPLDYFRWPGAAIRARAAVAAARAALVRQSSARRPPEEWQPELARWVAEAAARCNGAEPPPAQGRWCDDVPEYLRTLKVEHPDWLVGPVRDLIHFFQTGSWPHRRRFLQQPVRVTVPWDAGNEGVMARLCVCRVPNDFGELYPDPAILLFVQWDEEFTEALRVAWEEYATQWRKAQPRTDVRWRLEPFRTERVAWRICDLSGPSAGAGFGLGLYGLFLHRTSPGEMWAVTGKLRDAAGHLDSAGGYERKTEPFKRHSDLRLIVPIGDKAKCSPDWRDRVEEAKTVEQAWRITARGSRRSVIATLAVALAAAMLLVVYILTRPTVHEVRVNGRELKAFDKKGQFLWKASGESKFTKAFVVNREGIAVVAGTGGEGGDNAAVYAFRSDGSRWKHNTGKSIYEGINDNMEIRDIAVRPVLPGGKLAVVALATHVRLFPARMTVWRLHNGAFVGDYYHPGHLITIGPPFDADRDGTKDILVAGTNNAESIDFVACDFVACLSTNRLAGQAEPYWGDHSVPRAREIFYTRLPHKTFTYKTILEIDAQGNLRTRTETEDKRTDAWTLDPFTGDVLCHGFLTSKAP